MLLLLLREYNVLPFDRMISSASSSSSSTTATVTATAQQQLQQLQQQLHKHSHTPSHTRRQYPELPMTNKLATHSRKSCPKLLLLGSDSDWQSALDQQLLTSLLLLLAIRAWGRGGT